MIDIGDELIELRSKEKILKIKENTPKKFLDDFFNPIESISETVNASNCGEVEFTLLRQALRDLDNFPIMPRPAIIGPYQEKELKIGIKSNREGKNSIISSLACLEVLQPT